MVICIKCKGKFMALWGGLCLACMKAQDPTAQPEGEGKAQGEMKAILPRKFEDETGGASLPKLDKKLAKQIFEATSECRESEAHPPEPHANTDGERIAIACKKAVAQFFRKRCPLKNPKNDDDCKGCDYTRCVDHKAEMTGLMDRAIQLEKDGEL